MSPLKGLFCSINIVSTKMSSLRDSLATTVHNVTNSKLRRSDISVDPEGGEIIQDKQNPFRGDISVFSPILLVF
jgi:hypothetical protein